MPRSKVIPQDTEWVYTIFEDNDPDHPDTGIVTLAPGQPDHRNYIPRHSTGSWSSKGGTCIICSKRYGKVNCLVRAVYEGKGVIVCKFCSPGVADVKLRLWSKDMNYWTYAEKGGFV